jgi:hypothetical protein
MSQLNEAVNHTEPSHSASLPFNSSIKVITGDEGENENEVESSVHGKKEKGERKKEDIFQYIYREVLIDVVLLKSYCKLTYK